ncbi:MAG: hypothetical protein ACREBE_09970, partial [bacterium]
STHGALGTLATYYTITNIATTLVQLLLTERAIARLGVGRGAAVLPLTLATASLAAVAAPVLPVLAAARRTR